MVWVIAFGELFFGDLWCVVWGYGGMRTHFSLLNPRVKLEFCTELVLTWVCGQLVSPRSKWMNTEYQLESSTRCHSSMTQVWIPMGRKLL